MSIFAQQRFSMVEHQLRRQGITDEKVLAAMSRLPRHRFLTEGRQDEAYAPRAIPIGAGQTISQPYMVALMTQVLQLHGNERVLEIGTGSGYQAAVLGLLCARVYTVERIEELAARADEVLASLGIDNVEVSVGDGSRGWPAHAPYDRIIVTAAAPALPSSLLDQLADPGLLVVPVGDQHLQHLSVLSRSGGDDRVEDGCACRFVPLLGSEGFG